jgi:hypothetical protein
MKLQRSRNLDDKIVREIVEILDGWSDRLTWDSLLQTITKRLGISYTRQTLHKHERIRQAFVAKKAKLAESGAPTEEKFRDPVLQATMDRLARLEAENDRLKRENNNLLEQFVRWTHNAGTRGLSIEFLNCELRKVSRGQTDRSRGRKREPN